MKNVEVIAVGDSKELTYKQIEAVNEKIKSLDIKGKNYAPVDERIKAFRQLLPNGFILTQIIELKPEYCVIKAIVGYYNGGNQIILGNGTAREKAGDTFINKTSYVENCETSAVGRALGMLGLGMVGSLASAEEVLNALNNQGNPDKVKPTTMAKPLKATPLYCEGCGAQILPAEKSYSEKHYGKALCRECQRGQS